MGCKTYEFDKHKRITVYPSLYKTRKKDPGMLLKLIRKLVDIVGSKRCLLTITIFLLVGSQAWSQDVGRVECGMAQQKAQGAVMAGEPYKKYGQMVKTAAQSINEYLYKGVISKKCHSCIVSQFAQGIPVAEQESCGPAVYGENWMITFTDRGTLLPEAAIEFICNTVKSEIILWLERETNVYQKQVPFSNISCLEKQILLTEDLLGECPYCLNDPAVINFLEGSLDGIQDAKFVTVVHYLAPESPFYDHSYNSKYDFYFFKDEPLYPPLDVNNQGETLIHELMHKLGASDKYYDGPEQACKIDPATGRQYSGYDIMCHRIPDPFGGFGYITPPLSELIISEPTAKEIGWLSTE